MGLLIGKGEVKTLRQEGKRGKNKNFILSRPFRGWIADGPAAFGEPHPSLGFPQIFLHPSATNSPAAEFHPSPHMTHPILPARVFSCFWSPLQAAGKEAQHLGANDGLTHS